MEANMARFIFRVGALGIVIIAAVAFVPSLMKNSLHSSKDIYNLETRCWAPAHFARPHVEYANAECADQVRRNVSDVKSTGFGDEFLPRNGDAVNDIGNKPKAECLTFLFLAVELCLLFAFYAVMYKKDTKDLDKKMKEFGQGQEVKVSTSRFQIGACIIMMVSFSFLVFAPHITMATAKLVKKDVYHSGEILCSFDIRSLGEIHKYTLQCFYSYEEPSGVNTQQALMMNSALCGIIAIMSSAQVLRKCFKKD